MPLGSDYAGQTCSIARSLEVMGGRWTILIVRDAFFGVRRFADFASHLGVPRAVLAERLGFLVDNDVLRRISVEGRRREEYELTEKGLALWPLLRMLGGWGDRYYAPNGRPRVYRHAADDGLLGVDGRCARCRQVVPAEDTVMLPGPGAARPGPNEPVEQALLGRHRLLEPVRT